MQSYYCCLLAAAGLLLMLPGAAQAEPAHSAQRLLPLELRAASVGYDAAPLNGVANNINQAVATPDQNIVTITDVVDIPLVNELLDENGELDLPMGITVFDTMGDFSIGFGSDF
jgi:hypothetical protein